MLHAWHFDGIGNSTITKTNSTEWEEEKNQNTFLGAFELSKYFPDRIFHAFHTFTGGYSERSQDESKQTRSHSHTRTTKAEKEKSEK